MTEKELWEQYDTERDPESGSACPDFNDLGAYIEGNLDDEEREKIEAHLNRCPECLDLVLALREDIVAENEPLLRDLTLAENAWQEKKTRHKRSLAHSAWRIAAGIVFLLIARGGFETGMQTRVSADTASGFALEEDLDAIATVLNDKTWNIFEGEEL